MYCRKLHVLCLAPLLGAGLLLACGGAPEPPEDSTALVRLTDALEVATVESAGMVTATAERHWAFDTPQPDWAPVDSELVPFFSQMTREPVEDGLRLVLGPPGVTFPLRMGGLVVELGELPFDAWETVLVKARTEDRFGGLTVAYNIDEDDSLPSLMTFFSSNDDVPPMFNDGSIQTYAIPLRPRSSEAERPSTLRSLVVLFGAPEPAAVDVLSITLVPRGAAFSEPFGVRSVSRAGTTRETLYAHAPARLRFPVDVPEAGRLDFGLAVNPGETVQYRVLAAEDGEPLLDTAVDDPESWHQHSVDLGPWRGQSIELVLEASSDSEGAVALWGAPIVSNPAAPRTAERPNVIFYVIDGGDADLMSLYGYDQPTTPFLDQLASEAVIFDRAYSNSSWTQPSTVSFMTSLHHSVLGGLRRGVHSTAVPTAATTMAEHFRDAGYQTVSLTANPNAGRVIGMERGVDLLRDVETDNHSTASAELQGRFWQFRDEYPGGPTWAHFQTTDVHEPHEPEPPFAGRFVPAEERQTLDRWHDEILMANIGAFASTGTAEFFDSGIAKAGIDRKAYYTLRKGLYDETMAHQDHSLEALVAELKARGEWQDTLLVIASDHGHPAGTFTRFGRSLLEPEPEPWEGALFDAYTTRVPLTVVWPGQLEGGRRIDTPVSMIDVLPTLLDLVGLPQPAILQGQSLAPLLRGETQDVRPVILDEFRVDEASGEMVGNLEIIDGRWGASLEIRPLEEGADPRMGRHEVPVGGRWGHAHRFFPEVPNLLLYDLEQDPFATRAVNDAHPELVERYRRQLLDYWKAHRALGTQFIDSEAKALTPEQLEQLRALGYI